MKTTSPPVTTMFLTLWTTSRASSTGSPPAGPGEELVVPAGYLAEDVVGITGDPGQCPTEQLAPVEDELGRAAAATS